MAKRQASCPSPGKATTTKVPVCKVCLCCVCPLPTAPACRGAGRPNRARAGQVLLLQPLQSHGRNEQRLDSGWFLTEQLLQCRGCSSETPAQLKIHYFHLTRPELSRIKRELENKHCSSLPLGIHIAGRIKELRSAAASQCLLIHSQRQLHLDGVRGRCRTPPKRTHYHLQASLKTKTTLKHGRLSNAKEFLLSCFSRECLMCTLMQDSR